MGRGGGVTRLKLLHNNTKMMSAFITLIFSQAYSRLCEPDSFTEFKDFSYELDRDNNIRDFLILCVSTSKICITQ